MKRVLTVRPKNSSAFTLIELVISSALMSVILASAYVCLQAALASQKLIDSREEIVQTARVALRIISADLRAACPLSEDLYLVGMNRMLRDIEADNLDFATHFYTPKRAHEGDFCEVSYFLAEAPGSTEMSLWRRRDPTRDPEPFSGGNREEIARGVRGLRFEYYDGFEWFHEWGETDPDRARESTALTPSNLLGMPEAVRITLWFASTNRGAPDLRSSDPPLVFQTVAHLALAQHVWRASGTSSSSTPNSSAPGQPSPAR